MRRLFLPICVAAGLALASCGGSKPAATTAAGPSPASSATVAVPDPLAAATEAPTPSNGRSGAGVGRTYQQERARLRQLVLDQKRRRNKAGSSKPGGFFGRLLGTGNTRSSAARFRRGRNGNNIGSLNGLFGRRKGRR